MQGFSLLLASLATLGVWYIWRWRSLERARVASAPPGSYRPTLEDCLVGFVTNFFDTLGIGNFAPTTAWFKFRGRMPDEHIPGTLNTGHALPVVIEALVFISVVAVDLTTLVTMIAAAVAGAWLGVGVVAKLPRRAIQIGMGLALLVAGALFAAKNADWLPGGGEALGLHGARLIFAVGVSFLLGALMMLGIGLYAPCLVLVSLLGMSPLAAFPIMMGSCAFLQPVAAAKFVKEGAYNRRAALPINLFGVVGVLIAAFIVKELPLTTLKWLIVFVILFASAMMFISAFKEKEE